MKIYTQFIYKTFFQKNKIILLCILYIVSLYAICHISHVYTDNGVIIHKQYKANSFELKYNLLIDAIKDDKINDKQLKRIIKLADLSSVINMNEINCRNNKTCRHPLSVVIARNLTDKAKTVLNYRKENINNIKDIGDCYTKTAILNKNIELLDLLLEKGSDMHCCDRLNGFSCLMYAVYLEDLDMVTYLLNKGADINLKSTDINPELDKIFTAMDIALWKNNISICIKLLESYSYH